MDREERGWLWVGGEDIFKKDATDAMIKKLADGILLTLNNNRKLLLLL